MTSIYIRWNAWHINERTTHQQCTNRLLTEVYKFLNVYFPDVVNDVFHLRQNVYNLCNIQAFAPYVPRNNCLLNSVVYRANQLWETCPFDLNNSCLLELLKNWRCTGCQCEISWCWIHSMVPPVSFFVKFYKHFFYHDAIVYFRR